MSGGADRADAPPDLAVGAVVVDDDALLLVRRGRPPGAGQWSVPGGRVQRGETLAHAVVREVAEETGLEVVCGELIGWVERLTPNRRQRPASGDGAGDEPDAGYHFVILDFAATLLSTGDPVAGDDAAEARWVPLHEVGEYDLVEGLAHFLHEHGIIELIA